MGFRPYNSLIVAALTVLLAVDVVAQPYHRKIVEYVHLIALGESDQVAPKVHDLEGKVPQSAGFIYIEGLLSSDESEALGYFHVVADSFPRSEWADDALARLVECSWARGQRSDAERFLERLNTSYPASPYLTTNYLSHDLMLEQGDSSISTPRTGTEYAVQVGAFSIKANAQKLQARLSKDGYRVDIYENLLDGKDLLYLVWVGSYSTMEEAMQHQRDIKARYKIDGVVRVRSSWKRW